MIYHKYRLQFIGIPKNASTSIHTMLSNKTDVSHTHDTYIQDYFMNDEQLIESYYSFAVVRNPYDRLISTYTFNSMHGRIVTDYPEITSLKRFMQALYYYEYPELNADPSMNQQYKFISLHKHILVDRILRYENLSEEWKAFTTEYNSKPENKFKISPNLVLKNATEERPRDYMNMFDRATIKLCNEFFAKDFELFGYEPK